MKIKNIFKILIFTLSNILIKSEIRIPFKTNSILDPSTKILNEEEIENYVLNLIHNDIFIELEVGTPSQKIKSFIKFEEHPFFIQGKDINALGFNKTKSFTYKSKAYTNIFLDGEEEIKYGYESNDTILINNKMEQSKTTLKEMSFIFVTETKTESPSNIGLMIPNQYSSIPEISFINQLKNKGIINDYSFVINYNSKDEGDFIIGGTPDSYNNKYKSEFYKVQYAINKPKYKMYGLNFDSINYGNNNTNIGGRMQSKFLIDFGLIVGSNNYYDIIYEKFFKEKILKGFCNKKYINAKIEWREGEKKYIYFYCRKNTINICEMQNIKFIQKEMNFTFEFNYLELFHEIDNYLIFKIIFPERANFYWIFGKPWFEKYLMVFNQDKKTIGHYCYILNDSDTKKISPTLNPLLLTIIFILLIILIILVSAFYYCINNSRRRRLNEVNDDYEYNNQNNDNLIN
jgi:hypothetical protein